MHIQKDRIYTNILIENIDIRYYMNWQREVEIEKLNTHHVENKDI